MKRQCAKLAGQLCSAIFLLLVCFITTANAQNLVQSGFTSVLTPQYMASGTATRLPVMYRATVSGLTANTTYRFYTQGATNSTAGGGSIDFGTTNPGAGNPLLISPGGASYTYTTGPSLTTAGNFQTFTTDGAGNYTGWFGFVNTGNARFTAGNLIYPSIVIGSNTGNVLFRRALDLPITVLAFATSNTATSGTFLKENASLATAKNMVAVYDNTAGTGRPLYISPVESIGVAIASTIAGYSTTAGSWNAIIPNVNSNGVKRAEQRSIVDGSITGCATDDDGVWPTGSVNTVNPIAGATGLTIAAADAPLNSCIVCSTITVTANATPISCPGGTTTVTVTATGGVLPYIGTGSFTVSAGTYTYNITDVNGCPGTATLTIAEGIDTIKPTITAPNNISSGDGCNAAITLGLPVTADNCQVASVTNNAPASFPLGTTIVTWTVTDASGNSATATQGVTVTDAVLPVITAPAALNISATDGCAASGIQLGSPIVTDNCAVATVTNNAPASFPLGTTTITWTVADSSGNTATATQLITVSDTSKPRIALFSNNLLNGITGPSSSQSPYLKPFKNGIQFTSILTTGDAVGGYKMAGIPDGLGAFDNGNGSFTLLMNHEIGNTLGVVRAHGSKGAFVSKWIINKSNLSVISGGDLMQQVYLWDTTSHTYVLAAPGTAAFSRFCSADLPAPAAFYNSASGKGTTEHIYMNGEESGIEGRAMGHIVTGPNAGKSYELPYLGKFAWENSVASPATGDKTVVAGMDDGTGGQVYFYIGNKTTTGTEIDKAGLSNGKLYGVKVNGLLTEISGGVPAAGTAFSLFDQGFVQNKTGNTINNESIAAGVTTFLRPEDGAWDPANPNDFYFNTTNAFGAATPTRLWRLRFTDINNPELGGTIEAVLNGTESDQRMFDNLSIDRRGHAILLEDVGNNVHIGKIWQYNIASDSLFKIAYHDSTRFISGAPNFLTQDEESSGVIDVSNILGQGVQLVVVQAHNVSADPELVEGGQLLAMFNPYTLNNGNVQALDTVIAVAPFGSSSVAVNLGIPATADNCMVASVTNNAPASFPLGTTTVTWTATDGSGNASSINQTVIVTAGSNIPPTVSITSPVAPATYSAGATIPVQVSATDTDGGVAKVELYANGVLFATDSVAPYIFIGTNVEAGVYNVVARAIDSAGAATSTDTLKVTVTACTPVGSITGEGFTNIPGTQVADLTSNAAYPNNPSINALLNTFEYSGVGNNYGARVRGYICAPLTGNYTFYIAGDEQAGLWLSTDENPANKTLIAYNETTVGFRQYYIFPTQKSVSIPLVKGARYYIETLHKQGPGADHLSVAWLLPNGVLEAPIAGTRLSPVSAPSGARAVADFVTAMQQLTTGLTAFKVTVTPNPATSYFSVTTRSSNETPLTVILTDVLGRVIEKKAGVAANGTIQIGNNLRSGVYFAEVAQGAQKQRIKLVKQ